MDELGRGGGGGWITGTREAAEGRLLGSIGQRFLRGLAAGGGQLGQAGTRDEGTGRLSWFIGRLKLKRRL